MGSKRQSGLTLFVQRGQDHCRYFCASAKQNSFQIAAFGTVDAESSLSAIVEKLSEKKLKPKGCVFLLPRSEFDVNTFQIPDIEEEDVPQLISNLVSESHESAEITTDFVLSSKDENGSRNALSWTLPNSTLADLKSETESNSLKLLAITSQTMGSISLLRSLVKTRSPHAVVVTIANKSIDFSVIYEHKITHVRSIPFASDELQEITPRLISELQRTVAIVGGNNEKGFPRIYLFGDLELRKPVGESLTEEFKVPVSILNPLDDVEFSCEPLPVKDCELYAHLIGSAKAVFFDKLDVDLVSPKRAIRKTLPWRKIIWYSIAGSVLLGLGGFVILDNSNQQIAEVAEKRKQFDELARDARIVIEMKDELATIRAWRKNEVIWLDEIDQLSQQLPPREKSLIRRISMLANADGSSNIDLSVEVAENELVSGLENAIRTDDNKVKSKRVSESSDKTGGKWNFETSIQFTAKPPKLSFVKTEDQTESPERNKKESPTPVSTQHTSGKGNPKTPVDKEPDVEPKQEAGK